MRILLINPPHPSIGSRIPDEHLPPLGLLAVGGPLLDAGHTVKLLDAEFGPLPLHQIAVQAQDWAPEAILVGHSGSTSGHPVAVDLTRLLRIAIPQAWIIYGGVFPTFHWRQILHEQPQIDVIVRGEGEETTPALIRLLKQRTPRSERPCIDFQKEGRPCIDFQKEGRPCIDFQKEGLPGIAFRQGGQPCATPPAKLIADLDANRIGWELADLSRYSYWGGRRAVVVQFSRGCPHSCTYCGQRIFWQRWRRRDPQKFAAELAWLYRTQWVEVINFADEDPTASKADWRAFLEALVAEQVPLTLVGSTRADDIVRDADILPLYKQAGVARFLLGIENYDEETLRKLRKGGSESKDRQAISLLRENGILSMATYVVGFEEERDRDYWRGLRQLLSYDPDQIQTMYVTPHRWTEYFQAAAGRQVIQTDLRRWDYKHQVLATRFMTPWRVLLWVKLIEAVLQLRPRAIWRALAYPDRAIRKAMQWYYRIGRRVWPYELWNFLFRDRLVRNGPSLAEFWEAPAVGADERPGADTQVRPYVHPPA